MVVSHSTIREDIQVRATILPQFTPMVYRDACEVALELSKDYLVLTCLVLRAVVSFAAALAMVALVCYGVSYFPFNFSEN
uniref:Transmembrane protein n=1 Tax=Steinernema glaseri TaxID=37863 RepID=A0A1I7YV22_9BILA